MVEQSSSEALPNAQTGQHFFTVSTVTARIQEILQPSIGKQFWLKAEISSGRERGGHFYCTLVEADDGGKIIAQLNARIWRQSFDKIKAKFRQQNLTPDFSDGTVSGLKCSLTFHPQWGIALDITDADTSIALGELELRRQAILERLKNDGLFEPNKLLSVPFLPIRIGLITSKGSAACEDFLETIRKSNFGFKVLLADAAVQGEHTEKTVIKAMDTLEHLDPDLIVIIRGGGSKTDLSYLDNEAIARKIAGYQFPVWTGIGHEIDTSVLDYVANRFFKTPTAVAENIIAIFTELQRYLEGAQHHLKTSWNFNLQREKTWLNDGYIGLRRGTKKMLMYHISMLQGQGLRLSKNTTQRILAEQMSIKAKKEHLRFIGRQNLDRASLSLGDMNSRFSMRRFIQKLLDERQLLQSKNSLLKAVEPGSIIQRGFALLRDNEGNIVSTVRGVRKGAVLQTTVRDGEISSTVNSVTGEK